MQITTVYGPADDPQRKDFLTEMLAIRQAPATPGLITGDFNLSYKASDKNFNLNWRVMGKFRAALDSCQLMELNLQSRRFTWSSERENPMLVRLDRAFCNSDWGLLFQNFTLNALSTGASDHCSIILNQPQTIRKKAAFRFKNFWVNVNGFMDVVQQAIRHGTSRSLAPRTLCCRRNYMKCPKQLESGVKHYSANT